MKLEEMAAFFEARLDGYEQHMLQNIASAEDFYRSGYAGTAGAQPIRWWPWSGGNERLHMQ